MWFCLNSEFESQEFVHAFELNVLPGNFISLIGLLVVPERRSHNRLVCVVFPDLSRPSITMKAPRRCDMQGDKIASVTASD